MVKAISNDLRQRILQMILNGSSCRQAARHLGVGESTAIGLKRRYVEYGTIEPKRGGRLGSGKLERIGDYVLKLVGSKPDLTLREISALILEEKGVKACNVSVWLFLSREKMSYKKTLIASERRRADVMVARFVWRKHRQPFMRREARRLYFIDETFVNTKMVRTHGWCERGKRLVMDAPFGHWLTQSFIAALSCDGLDAPWVLNHPMCRESFDVYIET